VQTFTLGAPPSAAASSSDPGTLEGLSIVVSLVGMDLPSCSLACDASSTSSTPNDSYVGSFSCASSTADSICRLAFTIRPDSIHSGSSSEIVFNIPTPHTQAIVWEATSDFPYQALSSDGVAFGVSGIILPEPGYVLYGKDASYLKLLLQPTRFNGTDNLITGAPSLIKSNLFYFESQLAGSQVNASDYFNSLNGVGVLLQVSVTTTDNVAVYTVTQTDPQGVLLVSQLLAYISGIAGGCKVAMSLSEKVWLAYKRKVLGIEPKPKVAQTPAKLSDLELQPRTSSVGVLANIVGNSDAS